MKTLATADESLFWFWIAERHAIFLKRQRGEPKPWTTDPILQRYKFTNPFRENDRGTVWLREHFLQPHRDDDPGLVAFNICWYRMYNFWGTGEYLGWQTNWDVEDIVRKLYLKDGQVFTGAHIVHSRAGVSKIEAIVDVCKDLWDLREKIVACARDTQSLEQVFDLLTTVYCVGGFMGYEITTDLRHTRLLEDATDIMTWCNIGPGAKRGLQRLQLPATLDAMRELLGKSRASLPAWVPDLEMRDIEHSLCEFDKYCRVRFGEGEPRSKYPGQG